MSSRKQRSIPLGGRNIQVSLYHLLNKAKFNAIITHWHIIQVKTKWPSFANNIIKFIFVDKDIWVSNKISLIYAHLGPQNWSSMVHVMAWCLTCEKTLPKPMLIKTHGVMRQQTGEHRPSDRSRLDIDPTLSWIHNTSHRAKHVGFGKSRSYHLKISNE